MKRLTRLRGLAAAGQRWALDGVLGKWLHASTPTRYVGLGAVVLGWVATGFTWGLMVGAGVARGQEPVQATGKHSLWRVEGKGATVHLLGSIHFLKKDFYPLDPVIEEAYGQAGVVGFETDFKLMEDPKTQIRMATIGMCPVGKTIKDYLVGKESVVELLEKKGWKVRQL